MLRLQSSARASTRRDAASWVAVGALCALGLTMLPGWNERHFGQELFEGKVALAARVDGVAEPLPAIAAACSNCHGSPPAIGPTLQASSLTAPQPRRGGPPSRYDLASFCQTLRTGVDPAYVLLPKTMPRYALGDAQCQALWAHLSRL